MEKKLKITNVTQFEHLVRELEKNPSLAKGFTRGTVPANFKKKWKKITVELNAFGPPNRDSDGWQKVWRDLKFKVKKKISLNKAECNATGGGINKQLHLSPLEEAVANLMQFQKQLTPIGFVCGVQEAGFVVQEREEDLEINPNECEQDETWEPQPKSAEDGAENLYTPLLSISSTSDRKSSKKEKPKSNRECLLELHTNKQEKVLKEISRTLDSINNCLEDSKKIKEEKLELLKRRDKRAELLVQSELEMNKVNLEIQKKKLRILNATHPE